jgi:toxin ParE1/3/4
MQPRVPDWKSRSPSQSIMLLIRIAAMPQIYEVAFRDVRRGRLRRFPYVIYYRVLSDKIEVIAILHARRDPTLWQDRVN